MFYRKHPTFLLTKIGGFYFYSKHFSYYFHFLLRQTLKNQTNSRFLSAVCLMDIKNKNNINVGTMTLSGARVFRKPSKH